MFTITFLIALGLAWAFFRYAPTRWQFIAVLGFLVWNVVEFARSVWRADPWGIIWDGVSVGLMLFLLSGVALSDKEKPNVQDRR